jgi:hypothetical protein
LIFNIRSNWIPHLAKTERQWSGTRVVL